MLNRGFLIAAGLLLVSMGVLAIQARAAQTPRPAAAGLPPAQGTPTPTLTALCCTATPSSTPGLDLLPDSYLYYHCMGGTEYVVLGTYTQPSLPIPITTTMRFRSSLDFRDFLVPAGASSYYPLCFGQCVNGNPPYTLTVDLYNQVPETNETNNSSYTFNHIITRTPCPVSTQTPVPSPTNTRIPSPTATYTPCVVQFTDVPVGSTFYTSVRCLACRGIVGGYPCGGPGEPCPGSYFRPANNITRGQAAKLVSEAAGYGETVPSDQQNFSDVLPSGPFWLWVERIAGRGIIGGYPCGGPGEACDPLQRPYFHPNNNVTRGQLAKIVTSAANFNDPVPSTHWPFQDVPPNSTFWLWIEQLARRGIIGGYPCGGPGEPCIGPDNHAYFRPNNEVTRGQAAKIVANSFFPNCETPLK